MTIGITEWVDGQRLFPIRKGTLHKAKTIWIEKTKKHKGGATIVIGTQGKITKVKETKNKVHIYATFKNERKKAYSKNEATKLLLKAINLKKTATQKLLAKILYTNFNEQTLKKIEKNGAIFKAPRAFKHHIEGEKIYLQIGNNKKYYEV
jgi:hypothetical protein